MERTASLLERAEQALKKMEPDRGWSVEKCKEYHATMSLVYTLLNDILNGKDYPTWVQMSPSDIESTMKLDTELEKKIKYCESVLEMISRSKQ